MSEIVDTEKEENEPSTFREKAIREAKEWLAVFAWFVPLYLLFTGLIYEQRVIPSESMVPNLQVGDRVAVNKFAYGYSKYSVPFGLGWFLPEGRIFAEMPKRGEVVVFQHPHTDRVMIKRVLAVGGDQIELRSGQVILNGVPIPTQNIDRIRVMTHPTKTSPARAQPVVQRRETLGDNSYMTHQWDGVRGYDDTARFKVPEGHLFFVGDNRDNSVDARATTGHCLDVDGVISGTGCPPRSVRTNGGLVQIPNDEASIGFVPLQNVIGRADTVIFTTKRCNKQPGTTCPPKRLWRGL